MKKDICVKVDVDSADHKYCHPYDCPFCHSNYCDLFGKYLRKKNGKTIRCAGCKRAEKEV